MAPKFFKGEKMDGPYWCYFPNHTVINRYAEVMEFVDYVGVKRSSCLEAYLMRREDLNGIGALTCGYLTYEAEVAAPFLVADAEYHASV